MTTVTALSIDDVEPTAENVQSGKFPVWAYEHSYTKGEPTGLAKAFLDYLMTDDIQNTVCKRTMDIYPVTNNESRTRC